MVFSGFTPVGGIRVRRILKAVRTDFSLIFWSWRTSSVFGGLLAAAAEMALGLGIHGEAGIEQVSFTGARSAMQMVAEKLLPHTGSGDHVVLFSYYALLNLAIFAIAWVRSWRALNLLGFFFTFAIGTAWGVLRYQHALFGSTEPFLVLFLEDGPDEAGDGVAVREDLDDVGAAFDLAVEALDGVVRPHLLPVLAGQRCERGEVGFGGLEHGRDLRE